MSRDTGFIFRHRFVTDTDTNEKSIPFPTTQARKVLFCRYKIHLYIYTILWYLKVICMTAGVITHLQVSLPGAVTLCFGFIGLNSSKAFFSRSHLVNGFYLQLICAHGVSALILQCNLDRHQIELRCNTRSLRCWSFNPFKLCVFSRLFWSQIT